MDKFIQNMRPVKPPEIKIQTQSARTVDYGFRCAGAACCLCTHSIFRHAFIWMGLAWTLH